MTRVSAAQVPKRSGSLSLSLGSIHTHTHTHRQSHTRSRSRSRCLHLEYLLPFTSHLNSTPTLPTQAASHLCSYQRSRQVVTPAVKLHEASRLQQRRSELPRIRAQRATWPSTATPLPKTPPLIFGPALLEDIAITRLSYNPLVHCPGRCIAFRDPITG